MRSKSLLEIVAYLVVSVTAVAGGAFLSLQFLNPVSSQQPDPLPPPPPLEEPESEPVVSPQPESSSGTAASFDERPRFPKLPSAGETIDTARELEVFLEPFIYELGNRKDPFEPYVEKEEGSGVPLGPLQKFELEELQLIGIMWDIKNPKAMFVDPEKIVHVAERDQGIGRKNGYIAAIREGEVVVVEAERTEKGILYQTKVLKLSR